MAAKLFYVPSAPAISPSSLLVAGAQLYFYASETTSLQAIYGEAGLVTPLANPVVANAAGFFPDIYLDDTLVYRAKCVDPSTGETLFDVDPYYPGYAAQAEDDLLAAAAGAAAAQASAEAARDTTIALGNYRATFAAAIADFAVGEVFTTDASGTLLAYTRTGTTPFYVRAPNLDPATGASVRYIATAEQFGIVRGLAVDQSAKLQQLADYAKANNIRRVELGGGDIYVANTVSWPYGVTVFGARSTGNPNRPATRILPIAGGTFKTITYPGGNAETVKAVFLFNSLNGSTSEQPGFFFGGGMEDVLFDNIDRPETPVAGITGFVAAGHNYTFRRIGAMNMTKLCVRAPWEYSDNFRIEQCFTAVPYTTTSYQVEIAGHGDSLVIEGMNNANSEYAAIWIRGDAPDVHFTYQARINSVINGIIRNDCHDVVIKNWHCETSYLIYTRNSSTKVESSLLYQSTNAGRTAPVIEYQDLGTSGANNPVRLDLDNVTFRTFGRSQFGTAGPGSGGVGTDTAALFEVSMPQSGVLSLKNVRRAVNGANTNGCETAIRVCQSDGVTAVANFADYGEWLCADGLVRPQYKISYAFASEPYDGQDVYLGSVTSQNTGKAGAFNAALTTYYYQIVRLFDPVSAIGASTRTELSVAIAATTNVPTLTIFNQNRSRRGVFRIYRGTSAGSYDKVANVTSMAGKDPSFVDEGDKIAGITWTSRTAAAIDSYDILATEVPFTINGPGSLFTTEPHYVAVSDADVTLNRYATETIVSYGALTAARIVTLAAGKRGQKVRVKRGTGAFNLTVRTAGGGTRATLASPTTAAFAEVEYVRVLGDWTQTMAGAN